MKFSLATLVLATGLLNIAVPAHAGVFLSVTIAPPPLPVYTQPVCPGDGYLWTPGYWAYGPAGYYWVPGTWVLAPSAGLLWTPGYWGWGGGAYLWHAGFWGPHVGFYGSINYGFGFTGVGFQGGFWEGGRFRYNTAVTRVDVTRVHNVYNKTVIVNNTVVNTRASFNGPRGVNAQPSREEQAAAHERHVEATAAQASHERGAMASARPTGARPAPQHASVAHDAPHHDAPAPHNVPQRSQPAHEQPHSGGHPAAAHPEEHGKR